MDGDNIPILLYLSCQIEKCLTRRRLNVDALPALAVSLFIMIKVGAWLDARFQIGPYGTFVCVLIAIVAGFRTLYREVLRLEEEDAQGMEKK